MVTSARTLETVNYHPYITVAEREGLTGFEPLFSYERGSAFRFAKDLLLSHLSQPIDLLVGEDVSGRIPTLIARRLLVLAQADELTDSIPPTYFMASGRVKQENASEGLDTIWRRRLEKYTARIIGQRILEKVAITTDLSATGSSIRRIEDALLSHDVTRIAKFVWGPNLYLAGSEARINRSERAIVGVEKYPPEPISRRHPKFDGRKTAEFRQFLDDYTAGLYRQVMDAL